MSANRVDLTALPHEGRTLLRLHGPDTSRFLQGTLSNDIDNLDVGKSLAAALLTVKGKLVSDAVVLPLGEHGTGLLVPSECAEEVAANLDRHIIMDDVTVSTEGVGAQLVWGGSVSPTGDVMVFEARHPAPGQLVIGSAEALEAALGGVNLVDANTWTRHRIETASPAWGHELEPGRFPPEVGFVHAVSYDKGCFMGQEPLARIHARSQVNWVMVRVESESAPSEPMQLSHSDREDAGRWTTWASAEGKTIGLAIVRRAFAKPGTELSAAGLGAVHVVSEPLGDDPGVRG